MPVGRVIVLEWTKEGADVFFYRNGRTESQDDQFSGRVQPDMETLTDNKGTLSVTLKEVRLEDSGPFTCKTFIETSAGSKQHSTKTVELKVSKKAEAQDGIFEPLKDEKKKEDLSDGQGSLDNASKVANGSNLGVIVGVTLTVIFIAAMVTALMNRKRIKGLLQKLKKPYAPVISDAQTTADPSALSPPVSSKHDPGV